MTILPISAMLGIVSTRLIVQNFGPAAYAQYGLLIGIAGLLPFADLGISAAVMNAVGKSDDPKADPHVRAVLISSIRIAVVSAFVVAFVSIGISVLGAWPTLLGNGLIPGRGSLAAALCLVLIGAGIPFGIGQRILSATGRNHVTILLLGLQTPVVLITVLVMVQFKLPGGPFLAVVPYLVTLVLSICCAVVAGRKISPQLGASIRDAMRLRTVRGGRIFDVAWPMLIQMIALPVAMQTDRLILSHVSTVDSLAQYNLAFQMYNPVWQVTNAAGVALWPIFARARATNDTSQSPTRIALAFGGVGLFCCLCISLVARPLARIASDGQISVSLLMMLAFSLLMVCQAAKYPLGMYMTDARGLRFQAWAIVAMVPLNLGLSWILALWIGAPGPVLGSFVGVLVCQVLANAYYVRRDLRRRIAAGPAGPPQEGTDGAGDAGLADEAPPQGSADDELAEDALAEVGSVQGEISGKRAVAGTAAERPPRS